MRKAESGVAGDLPSGPDRFRVDPGNLADRGVASNFIGLAGRWHVQSIHLLPILSSNDSCANQFNFETTDKRLSDSHIPGTALAADTGHIFAF